MQARIFADMVFRDSGPSEDCLSLNIWTPASTAAARLPVMVWIYGGGFQAGGASEPRQDGEVLAHQNVIVVSLNYRLGIFGFLAHPGLKKESGQAASGNYGLLDQVAGLQWVHDNIAAFGGDPRMSPYSANLQAPCPLARWSQLLCQKACFSEPSAKAAAQPGLSP